jgi:hypothetical protein
MTALSAAAVAENARRQSNSMGNADKAYDPKDKAVLNSALPPWHAVAFVVSVMTLCIHQCGSTVHSLDEVAVLSTFTKRVFPESISLAALGWIRLAIALSIWMVLVSTIMSEGWIQMTKYYPGSKLQSGIPIVMRGSRTLLPFTSWCWILLGISYTYNAAIALAVVYQGEGWVLQCLQSTPWILRTIVLTWETAAPCAFIVSSVIRYVIWDKVLKGGPERTVHLKRFNTLMSHNMNSVFVLTEIALLGGLPVRLSEIYVGALVGTAYVWMAWALSGYWAAKEHGPHYIYFFLDTTLGYTTTIALMALMTALCLFYLLLSMASVGLNRMSQISSLGDDPGHLFILHLAFVLGISSLVCRFND